jgi:hypothetical protein
MNLTTSEAQLLIELETRLLRPETRSSRQALDRLLADDFTEIGKSGRVYDKQTVIAGLVSESGDLKFIADNFETRVLARDLVLLTYQTSLEHEQKHPGAIRSSIWRRSGRDWQLVFHQGTPAPAIPPLE